MNPDTGEEAEDWFARFEREAREAARQRDPEGGEPQPGQPGPTAAPPPQLTNPFHAPAVPPPAQYPPQYPAQPFRPVQTPVQPPAQQPPAASPVAYPPTAQQPPSSAWDQPTQAMGMIEPEPTQAMPAQPDEPGQDLVRAPLRPPGGDEPGSALDALFGEDRFREYEAGPDPNEAPFANRARSKDLVRVAGGEGGEPPPPRELGTLQKALIGVGAGLLAILALIGLFVLGTRLPDLLGPAPAIAPSPSPTPTPTALPVGPVEPGTYRWDELLGGECLDPFVDAWQDEYEVVDCEEPHGGQLVLRAWFPDPDLTPEALAVDPTLPQTVRPGSHPYPGADALAEQISLLCNASGVVNLAAASAYADAQIQGAYPATEAQWDENPSYYCFVSRSSGEPLTGSVATPLPETQPAPSG